MPAGCFYEVYERGPTLISDVNQDGGTWVLRGVRRRTYAPP